MWKGYGKLVKLFRERAMLTQPQLADAVGYSPELVASIEQGRRPAKPDFTSLAEQVLNAGGALSALQDEVDLARLPTFFHDFAVLELDAVSRFDYEHQVVPGLLQTEDYARALLNAHCPRLDDEIVEERVDARLRRQALLTREPAVEFAFVIGEAALRCPVGGLPVLKAQLEQLLARGEQRNVDVQVMPTAHGAHAGLHGPMALLETTDHRRIVYFESHGESLIISDPAKVSAFALRYGRLRSQALNADDSARFIKRMVGEL